MRHSITKSDEARLRSIFRTAADDVRRGKSLAIVEARGVQQIREFLDTSERSAERYRRELKEGLAEMEATGRSPAQVARRKYPNNSLDQYNYAQCLRKARRKKRCTGCI